MISDKVLLEVKNLKQYFPIKGGIFDRVVNHVKAVDDISFVVHEGETLSIVGESGCGKSTTGRAIIRLDEPYGGEVLFEGKDLVKLNRRQMRDVRGDIQIIFQDPYASLNPRQTVYQIINEAMTIQKIGDASDRRRQIAEILETVGLGEHQMGLYPHQFSGGQRQRIGIARALSVRPKLIICDEAVSALDVSIQAQILNLMQDLQAERELTYIFITHDLSVVKHISDYICVMYLGHMVELCPAKDLFKNQLHPYTKALLSAIPQPKLGVKRERIMLKGELTSPINPKPGCRFAPRCLYAKDNCFQDEPKLEAALPGHLVACHYVKEINGL